MARQDAVTPVCNLSPKIKYLYLIIELFVIFLIVDHIRVFVT